MSNSKEIIKDRYAKALRKAAKDEESSCCPPQETKSEDSSCCGSTSETRKEIKMPSFGSSSNLAEKANLSEGDVVVDLGSGPGYDLISAAKIVGPNGIAIGIDFTSDMVDYATKKAEEMGLDNVSVYQGDIEDLPLEDSIADVIISNCVINLTMDKQAVFNEAFRILKPGGRLVDADIIAGEELPESLRKNKDALCGCIGGALTEEGYVEKIRKAGFQDIKVDIENTNNINWKGQIIPMHSGIITAIKPMS
jgi:SAM-dependent methyltransferase